MKTIFIFNDSRFTDLMPTIAAIGEDGQCINRVELDRWLAPHFQFVMGVAHQLDAAIEPSISTPVRQLRARVLADYDRAYGEANWIPIWLEAPAQNFAWVHAMQLYRQRKLAEIPVFSDEALGRVFIDVIGAAVPSDKRTVH